jgi:hypothetical protein
MRFFRSTNALLASKPPIFRLGGFENHVADETVADDDIGVPVVDIAPLGVADEVETRLFQNAEGLFRELVALSFFFTNRQEADARRFDVEEHLRVKVTHDRELAKVTWLGVDVRTDVEEKRVSLQAGKDRCKRRTAHAFDHAHHCPRRGPGRAGVAGGNECLRAPLGHQIRAHAHRRVPLPAQRRQRGVLHCDDLSRVDDRDVARDPADDSELLPHGVFLTDENDLDRILRSGQGSALHHLGRRMIAAHGIQSDGDVIHLG